MHFIGALGDERVINDCLQLVEVMRDISGDEPKLWGPSIIGFGTYHYKYDSGREGDMPVIAFSPRKGKLVVYIDETARFAQTLAKLGKHTTGKVCVYIKHLDDINLGVLRQLIQRSYDYTKSHSMGSE